MAFILSDDTSDKEVDAAVKANRDLVYKINSPRIGGPDDMVVPRGYFITAIKVSKGVGGKYAVDALGELEITCRHWLSLKADLE